MTAVTRMAALRHQNPLNAKPLKPPSLSLATVEAYSLGGVGGYRWGGGGLVGGWASSAGAGKMGSLLGMKYFKKYPPRRISELLLHRSSIDMYTYICMFPYVSSLCCPLKSHGIWQIQRAQLTRCACEA